MTEDAASSEPRRLCVYNGGLLMRRHMRRILSLKGWNVTTGVPGADDWVGIWGRTPTAWRGEAVAGWAEAPVLTVEDAFLRSVHPARLSEAASSRSGFHWTGPGCISMPKKHLILRHCFARTSWATPSY